MVTYLVVSQVYVLNVDGVLLQSGTYRYQRLIVYSVIEIKLVVALYHYLYRVVFILRLFQVPYEPSVWLQLHSLASLVVKL